MKTRWMNRRNEVTGENERFYPITHTDAIVGLDDYVSTEAFAEVEIDDPTLPNIFEEKFTVIEERLASIESEIDAQVARLANI